MTRARLLSSSTRFTLICLTAAVLVFSAAVESRAASILIAPSEDDDAAFRAALAAMLGGGSTVDYFDARLGTPSVATLLGYDAVFTWTNFNYADEELFGDNLADYVDSGGRVILGAFTTYTSGNNLGGDIMTSGYSPVVSPFGSNSFSNSCYVVGSGTSALWTGVASYCAIYRDIVVLQGGGIQDGIFADGVIAAAYRPDFGVIYIGGLVSNTILVGGMSGDYIRLLANAVTIDQQQAVPEPTSLLLLGAGLAAAAGRRVVRRKN